MGIETAPAFQIYVKEWRSSRAVQRMSFSERGLYFEMLLEQWENLSLADDPKAVAALLATTTAQELEIEAAWTAVRRKFVEVEGQPGRIMNLRLERVRRERRRFVKIARKGGRARAEQAARSASGTFQPSASGQPAASPADAPAALQPPTSTASASSSASASSTATASPKKSGAVDVAFDAFWAVYPNKTGKDAARKIWTKRRHELPPIDDLIASVSRQSASTRWMKDDGQYIPNPATWLNQGRWQDEAEQPGLSMVSDRTRHNAAGSNEALRLIAENEHARQR